MIRWMEYTQELFLCKIPKERLALSTLPCWPLLKREYNNDERYNSICLSALPSSLLLSSFFMRIKILWNLSSWMHSIILYRVWYQGRGKKHARNRYENTPRQIIVWPKWVASLEKRKNQRNDFFIRIRFFQWKRVWCMVEGREIFVAAGALPTW